MKLGDTAQVGRAFGLDDVARYVALGGPSAAEGEVPDPLVGALFSYLLGVELPGPGTNYLKQESRYLRPGRIGERLVATVEVTQLRPDKHLVDFVTRCVGEDGSVVCEGRALVHVSDVAR